MEEGTQRPSIVKPVVIVAGMIIILAAIKAAAAILGLFFLAVFLAISFTPAFGWLKRPLKTTNPGLPGCPDWEIPGFTGMGTG